MLKLTVSTLSTPTENLPALLKSDASVTAVDRYRSLGNSNLRRFINYLVTPEKLSFQEFKA